MTSGSITVFTAERPAVLGKTFRLSPSGELEKQTAAQMSKGRFKIETFDNAHALAALLQNIGTDQAISASLPTSGDEGGVVVAEKLLAQTPGAVTRSKRHFGLPDTPGLLTLDYDPEDGKPPMQPATLWQALLSVAPALAGAGVVHWHSGSSFIFDRERELKGLGGQRIYIMAASLADVPRALQALNARLWLAGIGGHAKVSSSGSILVRSLFDAAMGDAGARLDFIGGSICTPPLEQRRGAPTVLAAGDFIDTRQAIPDLSADEQAAHAALIEQAKHQAEPQALAQREAWKAAHVRQAVALAATEGADLEQVKAQVTRTLDAALGGNLVGTFTLTAVDAKGREHTLSVDEVLSDRERWHLSRFLSPLDPDHRDRAPDAILYSLQPSPVLYDLNDGGTCYRLLKQPTALQVRQGGRAELAGQIADQLKDSSDLFVSAGSLVLAQRGGFAQVSKPMLAYLIGTRAALFRQGKDRPAAVDIDQQTADQVHALLLHRARTVSGRASIPLICPDGRIIERPGLDEQTSTFLDLIPGEFSSISDQPSRSDTVEALRRLWAPWRAYSWASASDRAAMLATVLTVPLRPTIDAAPGLFADAPLQASGKSKAVGAVAALARGSKAAAKTWIGGQEAETEKFLLGMARAGDAAVIFDNAVGVFDSATLASAMAEGRVGARLLGVNENLSPDARVLWLASGNNASLSRDMSTRWLRARIDTGSASPHTIAYPFDPVEAALADRMGIVRAILTVQRAWHAAGCPRADQINTRFAQWGRTVRQIALWLRDSGIAQEAGIGQLGDPADSILDEASVTDPEGEALGLLLYGLGEVFGAEPFSTREVFEAFKAGESSAMEGKTAIHEGIAGLLPRARAEATSRSIGAALKNRRDRPAFGLKLTEVPQFGAAAARGSMWRVVQA